MVAYFLYWTDHGINAFSFIIKFETETTPRTLCLLLCALYKPNILFDQAATEKVAKQLQQQLNEVQSKLDETNRTLNDFDSAKKKLSIENSDLLRQLEEAESQVSQLSKIKISLTTQLEDTKRLADEESRVRQSFSQLIDKGHQSSSPTVTRF